MFGSICLKYVRFRECKWEWRDRRDCHWFKRVKHQAGSWRITQLTHSAKLCVRKTRFSHQALKFLVKKQISWSRRMDNWLIILVLGDRLLGLWFSQYSVCLGIPCLIASLASKHVSSNIDLCYMEPKIVWELEVEVAHHFSKIRASLVFPSLFGWY